MSCMFHQINLTLIVTSAPEWSSAITISSLWSVFIWRTNVIGPLALHPFGVSQTIEGSDSTYLGIILASV